MLLKMYKTLFFAILSLFIWFASVVLAFFGGMIAMSIWQDKEDKKKESSPGSVRYTSRPRRSCDDVPIPGE